MANNPRSPTPRLVRGSYLLCSGSCAFWHPGLGGPLCTQRGVPEISSYAKITSHLSVGPLYIFQHQGSPGSPCLSFLLAPFSSVGGIGPLALLDSPPVLPGGCLRMMQVFLFSELPGGVGASICSWGNFWVGGPQVEWGDCSLAVLGLALSMPFFGAGGSCSGPSMGVWRPRPPLHPLSTGVIRVIRHLPLFCFIHHCPQ